MKMNETRVPVDVRYDPAYLSWVAATSACLHALGVECDTVDVAGMSGYAFHLGIARGLCPSGPTAFNWGSLLPGVHALGRSTLVYHDTCFEPPRESERVRQSHLEAFNVARREIEAGRPCVIWGAYIPEFAAAYGVTEDAYLVSSFKSCTGEAEPPVGFNDLDAPGGPYVLAFPVPAGVPQREADRRAVCAAVARFQDPSPGPLYRYGAAAYDCWIEELEGRRADAGGNSYNAACYAEGRLFARDFIRRIAARNSFVADELELAAKDYSVAAEAMSSVESLFPFPGRWGSVIDDDEAITSATHALRDAQEAETRAVGRLEQVAQMEWP
jgi:hypothetical protein